MARRLSAAIAVATATVVLAPVPGQAADASRHHHHHVDRRSNNTGDAQVDRLNEGQLDANYRGPWHWMNGQPPPPGTPYEPLPRGYPPIPSAGYGPPGPVPSSATKR